MKVSFNYDEASYKRHLISSRKINNIVVFILGLLIYIILTYKNVSLIFLPLFTLGLILLIFLLNILFVYLNIKLNKMTNKEVCGKYVVELTPNKFSITINNNKTNYKYKNIKKIKIGKKGFKIKLKNSREYLVFDKNLIKDEDYIKMLEYLKNNI